MVRKTLLLLLLLSTVLMANIGKIVALKGDLTIVRDSTEIVGTLGSQIQKADEILTKDNAKAQLLFNDNTVITIGKNSVFKVKEYLFDDVNKEYKTNFELLKGSFRTITGKIGKIAPNKFKLNSKTSSIGIRGTQILSRMAVSGDRIACIEGEIIITHLITGQTIVIKAGEFVDLGVDTKTLKPQKMKQKDVQDMNDSTRFTLNDEKEVKLDNLDVVASTPENVAWGEWNEEAEETEDSSNTGNSQGSGSVTNPDVIVNATHTATYTGKIEGTHTDLGGGTGNGTYIDNATNSFKMTVNFGTRNINHGEIIAEHTGGGSVNITNITGTVKTDGSGFDLGNGNWNGTTTGSGSGKFYGSNGNIVKGDFSYTEGGSGYNKAEGTFNGQSE